MAAPLSATALLAVLRAEGLTVHEVRDWRNHNRNSKGAWGPVHGVLLHHTVSSGTANSVDLCYDGHADLPGPLCHGVIDKKGEVWLVGNGRANHAGGGDPAVLKALTDESYGERPPATHEHEGSAGAVDGNRAFYGFECVNLGDGQDPWPDVQVEAMVRASAAICRAHGWSEKSAAGHKEWSDWKSDPTLPMPTLRARIAARLAHPASWSPTGSAPTNPEETTVALTDDDIKKIARATVTGAAGMKNPDDASVDWALSSFVGLTYRATRQIAADVAALRKTVDALAVGGVDLDALADRVVDRFAARLAE
ncbi:peptidoglycan recognition family protein [Streptomyces longwoodensis]|uniref:peptidoglycan recognition protein family protein n=1 Tax=Streptomyces longwoodensis TaxID=68231 RepID=UPI0033C1E9E0